MDHYVKDENLGIDLCIYLAIQKQIVRFNIPVKTQNIIKMLNC